MKLDELPFDALIKIFKYFGNCKKVSLVSRKFYKIACIVSDENVSLTLNHRLLHLAHNTLHSIKKSNRKISKVEICFCLLTKDDLLPLLSILSKFSATIKYLRIEYGYIEMDLFIKILSLVPNAEHLSLRRLRLSHDDKNSNREVLNLKHLRILELLSCKQQFQVVFNRLPANVLTQLLLNEGYLFSLDELFSRQTSIKKLSLCYTQGTKFPLRVFRNMELKSLEIKNAIIGTATLSKQTKLKTLTLEGRYQINTNQHLMDVVASSFTELEELNWDVTTTSVIDFVNIERLKNLKHLRLIFRHRRPDIVDGLIKLDNSRLESFDIIGFGCVEYHKIQALAKSAPNLKVVKFFADYLKCMQITAVLKHFNFVKCLSLGRIVLERMHHYCWNPSDTGNENLTELHLFTKQYEMSVLAKVMTDFPNLKTFKVVSRKDLRSSHFRLIVDGFTKLESLDLCHGEQLTIDDFQYLRDHRKLLQTLWLRDTSDVYVDRHMNDLKAMFGVVQYVHIPSSLVLKM